MLHFKIWQDGNFCFRALNTHPIVIASDHPTDRHEEVSRIEWAAILNNQVGQLIPITIENDTLDPAYLLTPTFNNRTNLDLYHNGYRVLGVRCWVLGFGKALRPNLTPNAQNLTPKTQHLKF